MQILRGLRDDSGTGPDHLFTKILKNCAKSLERPITMMARKVLTSGRWPELWKYHWIYPLFKKKMKSDPNNYRGIHLTPQLSKIVERILGGLFLPYLESIETCGPNQFAYRRERGLRDALAFNVMSWIFMFHLGQRVGLYCSDVSGAFDGVSVERLHAKLSKCGIHKQILEVIWSWLQKRKRSIVVDGTES